MLCTSFLHPNGAVEEFTLSDSLKSQLKYLEKATKKLLEVSLSYGQVFIITNAADGWIEYSTKKYMPSVKEPLKSVRIISARTTFEHKFPGDSHEWKMQAFLQTLKELELGAITNLVALGDSNIEMDAAQHLAT